MAKKPRVTRSGRNILKGRSFRAKAQAKGWAKCVFFSQMKPACNLSRVHAPDLVQGTAVAAGPAIQGNGLFNPNTCLGFDPDAREIWYGPMYNAGAAGPPVFNGSGNPTTNGDGLLLEVAKRDDTMDFNRWEYTGHKLNHDTIRLGWNAINNNGGGAFNVPIGAINIKGIKVTMQSRSRNLPSLCYVMTRKDANSPVKLREGLGKSSLYVKTVKQPAGQPFQFGGVGYRWNIPQVWLGAYVYTRLRYTIYYKVRPGALPN